MDIFFTNISGIDSLSLPQPASSFIPEWYKKLDGYIGKKKKPNGFGETTATIKRCMPVFDAIASGYIITSAVDVFVSLKKFDKNSNLILENSTEKDFYLKQYFEWPLLDAIHFHPIEQAPSHPVSNGMPYPKWINFWGIKTPKGYSTMFVQPMHRESVFTIMPGIVDTDKYNNPVNFPFVMNDPNWEGLIPKGTPIAQLIPIKRESWKAKNNTKKEKQKMTQNILEFRTKFFDIYKESYRSEKKYN